MRDYAKVAPQFWSGDTGRALRDLGMKYQLLAFYLMTCPSANMIGLYYLPLPTVSHETGIPLREVSATLEGLVAEGFATYDEGSEYVFVVEMARFQIGEALSVKDNRRISVIKELKAVKTHLVQLFLDRYGKCFNLGEPVYPEVTHDRFPTGTYARLIGRDGERCKLCGTVENLTIDHVLAKINGGKKNPENLQLLCVSCNSEKAAEDRSAFWNRLKTPTGGVAEGLGRGWGPPSKPGAGAGAGAGGRAGRGVDVAGAPSAPPGGAKPEKVNFTERVRMTQVEHDALVAKHGAVPVTWMIQRLHDQIEAKGDKWKSHAAAIRSWVVDAYVEHLQRTGKVGQSGICSPAQRDKYKFLEETA